MASAPAQFHTIFYLRHHFVSEFCCLKDRGNVSLLQSKLKIPIFYYHSQSVLFAWGISLLTVPSLHHTEQTLPDKFFPHLYLPVLFYTATWNQAWAEKKSWMSPKQSLISAFNCKFTSNGRLPVPLLHTETSCSSGGLLMTFPVLLLTNLTRSTFQNLINYGFSRND